jgi:hypothetical protein
MVVAAQMLQMELVKIKSLTPSDSSIASLVESLCRKLFGAYSVLKIQVSPSDVFSSQQVEVLFSRFRDLQSSGSHGKFEWIDGTLIRAMEAGHWVLIDNVNFCSPSVLDRLNPLLEPNGSLMVNERGLVDGQVKIVYPHPNFRLFLSMDPRHGEISRAMRNRSIEISLDGFSCASSRLMLKQGEIGLNRFRVLSSTGLHGTFITSAIYRIHQAISRLARSAVDQGVKLATTDYVSDRDVLQLARMVSEKMQRGESWSTLLQTSIRDVYLFYAKANDYVASKTDMQLSQSSKESFEAIINEVDEIVQSTTALVNSPASTSMDSFTRFVKDSALATLWPLQLTGEMWCSDSNLASVLTVSSIMDDLLMESRKQSFGHSTQKELQRCLISRCRDIYGLANESNWKLLLVLLSYRQSTFDLPGIAIDRFKLLLPALFMNTDLLMVLCVLCELRCKKR